MGDYLHRSTEVFPVAFARKDFFVELAGGERRKAVEVGIEKTFVVAEVEVGFRAVFGNEHFAVLERAHRSRVDVEVSVELLAEHAVPHALEKGANGSRDDAFSDSGEDSARNEDDFHEWMGYRWRRYEKRVGETL